jgi:hypothetical protein
MVMSNPALDWVQNTFALMPEASYDGDFRIFAFQKDVAFQEKYSCETNMNVDLALLRVKKRFFLMFRSEIKAGCGDSPLGMVFHPYDVSYGIIPTLEYRFKPFHISTGVDHRCFHVIDRKPKPGEPVVYWNKFIISMNSPHRRAHPYVSEYIKPQTWDGISRFIWNFTWGYYITDFFGLIEPNKLMTRDYPRYRHDFQLTARYGLAQWKWGAATLTGSSMLGSKIGRETYWAQEIGAEVLFSLRPFDTSLFVNYIFDKGRFDSKDRLLEYGIRVVK